MKISFREVLKHETHSHHARVDDALSALNLAQPADLARFLSIHQLCFQAMIPVAAEGSKTWAYLTEMDARIATDLAQLAQPRTTETLDDLAETDPLALDYMIEGSRLGSQILKRRWTASEDKCVQAANAYFTLKPTQGRWRQVCDELAAIATPSARASKITADTRGLFDMFYAASTGRKLDVLKNLENTQ